MVIVVLSFTTAGVLTAVKDLSLRVWGQTE